MNWSNVNNFQKNNWPRIEVTNYIKIQQQLILILWLLNLGNKVRVRIRGVIISYVRNLPTLIMFLLIKLKEVLFLSRKEIKLGLSRTRLSLSHCRSYRVISDGIKGKGSLTTCLSLETTEIRKTIIFQAIRRWTITASLENNLPRPSSQIRNGHTLDRIEHQHLLCQFQLIKDTVQRVIYRKMLMEICITKLKLWRFRNVVSLLMNKSIRKLSRNKQMRQLLNNFAICCHFESLLLEKTTLCSGWLINLWSLKIKYNCIEIFYGKLITQIAYMF